MVKLKATSGPNSHSEPKVRLGRLSKRRWHGHSLVHFQHPIHPKSQDQGRQAACSSIPHHLHFPDSLCLGPNSSSPLSSSLSSMSTDFPAAHPNSVVQRKTQSLISQEKKKRIGIENFDIGILMALSRATLMSKIEFPQDFVLVHQQREFRDPLMIKNTSTACQVDRFNNSVPLLVPEFIHVLLTNATRSFGINPQTCRQFNTSF